jgi:hypothetical protein
MERIDFYSIDKAEKEAIFNAVATEKGMKAFAVEKDWWVSRTLEIIFQMPIAQYLVFKGGVLGTVQLAQNKWHNKLGMSGTT